MFVGYVVILDISAPIHLVVVHFDFHLQGFVGHIPVCKYTFEIYIPKFIINTIFWYIMRYQFSSTSILMETREVPFINLPKASILTVPKMTQSKLNRMQIVHIQPSHLPVKHALRKVPLQAYHF